MLEPMIKRQGSKNRDLNRKENKGWKRRNTTSHIYFCMWVYPLTCGTEHISSSGVIFAIWAELFSKTMPKKYSYISAELESIFQAPQGLNNAYILYSLFLKYLLLHS